MACYWTASAGQQVAELPTIASTIRPRQFVAALAMNPADQMASPVGHS